MHCGPAWVHISKKLFSLILSPLNSFLRPYLLRLTDYICVMKVQFIRARVMTTWPLNLAHCAMGFGTSAIILVFFSIHWKWILTVLYKSQVVYHVLIIINKQNNIMLWNLLTWDLLLDSNQTEQTLKNTNNTWCPFVLHGNVQVSKNNFV